MVDSKTESKLAKSFSEQWMIRLKTTHPDGDKFDCLVMQNCPEFVVVRESTDFEFDGFVLLSKADIKGVRDGKYERCSNQIIRLNRSIERLHIPDWLGNCHSIPEILAKLKKDNVWPAIEIVFDNGANSALYIGPITAVGRKTFRIRSYDAAGKWETNYKLNYDEIFKIEFDSRYTNNFNAFMRTVKA